MWVSVFLLALASASLTVVDSQECGWHKDDYKCANDKCILKNWVCDGENDCGDDSDEDDCVVTTPVPTSTTTAGYCRDFEFQCRQTEPLRCVHWLWRCDGDIDCPDGSDELDCNLTTTTTSSSTTTHAGTVADREGEFSSEATTGEVDNFCDTETEFQCVSVPDSCIFLLWRCDGDVDCADSSDEADCPGSNTTPASDNDDDDDENENSNSDDDDSENMDDNGDDNHSENVDDNSDNDDNENVDDNRDDDDNENENGNSDDHNNDAFTATTTTIVHSSTAVPSPSTASAATPTYTSPTTNRPSPTASATMTTDIPDSSHSSVCSKQEFGCLSDSTCIHRTWRCDGDEDCSDASDELNCQNFTRSLFSTTPTTVTEITPTTATEIATTPTTEITTTATETATTPTTVMFTTTTTTASSAASTTTRSPCRYNEFYCAGEVGVMCIARRLRCDGTINCPSGVDEEKCKKNCVDSAGQSGCPDKDTQVLTAVSNRYVRIDHLASGTHKVLLNKSVNGYVAVDFHYARRLVFGSNVADGSIERLDLHDNSIMTVVSEGTEYDGLAVDWIHNNIYWTNLGRRLIEVAKLDGSLQTTLHNESIDKPRAIAVHPGRRFLFWTDWGLGAKIERCGLNGKHRKIIVSTNIVWPNGITIGNGGTSTQFCADFKTNQLYWTDARLKRITTSDLDGNNPYIILRGSRIVRFPFAISVFREYLYWTDWSTRTVRRFNRANTDLVQKVSNVVVGITQPMGLTVFHPDRQPVYENACGTNNGGCSQLCLGDSETNFTCVCSDGFLKDPKDHTQCFLPGEASTTVSTESTTNITDRPTTGTTIATSVPQNSADSVTASTLLSTEWGSFNITASPAFALTATVTPFQNRSPATTQTSSEENTSMSTATTRTTGSLFYMALMGFKARSQHEAIRMLEQLKNTARQMSGNQTIDVLDATFN